LSILNTKAGHNEVWFRQVSLDYNLEKKVTKVNISLQLYIKHAFVRYQTF